MPRISTTPSACGATAADWKLWVHIADVSHYVQPGGALDEEARQRGNSTYLVDRVIPMLPEALSNELCSLKPGADRLTKCVEFLLSDEGRVLNAKFYPAVIRSAPPLHLQGSAGRPAAPAPRDPIEQMLAPGPRVGPAHPPRPLSGPVRSTWIFPNPKFVLTNRAASCAIERIENDVSHQLIEEFMLLANEAVAARLMALRRPAVYRVHEPPDERRLQEYRQDVLSHQHSLRQPRPAARSAETPAAPQHPAHRPGAEDRFPQIAHARPLRRRTAGPLRPGQAQIHPLHLAHPPLRRSAGPSRLVR